MGFSSSWNVTPGMPHKRVTITCIFRMSGTTHPVTPPDSPEVSITPIWKPQNLHRHWSLHQHHRQWVQVVFGTSDMIVVTATVCNLHCTCSVAESHPSAIWQLQVWSYRTQQGMPCQRAVQFQTSPPPLEESPLLWSSMAQILGNSSHRSHPEHACTCCKERKYDKKGLN